ncbi:hypothetical protein QWA68_011390 [Fusarium oxysporum]|nr:hypothetical protein QWA68_011390 [Fusarium oxysporum]
MSSMLAPNALKRNTSQLPAVIQHAIELTDNTGERYLWVGRLCIVQDGPQKQFECMRMDEIYSGAYVTIVAAAEGGLFRNYSKSSKRSLNKTSHKYKMSHDARIIRYHQELVLSRWSNREWTYKEYIISKRAVFFLKTSMFWQCECAVWDTASLRPNKNDEATNSNITSNWSLLRRLDTLNPPDFGIYTDLLSPYNGRGLSFQEDGLTACLGILNRLVPAFPDGIIFGLPRHHLDYELLWKALRGPFDNVDSAYLLSYQSKLEAAKYR